jgi:phospholipase/lecithinase/hemolysin
VVIAPRKHCNEEISMPVSMRRLPLLILALILSAMASIPASAGEQLVIFGDSLSDPGNYFIAFGQTSTAPFAPIPDAPYDIGPGHHFSDGWTWAERLAFALGSPESGMPRAGAPGRVHQLRRRPGACPA